MNWKASRPAIEIAAESIAAACLGGAVVFAVAQFGLGIAMAGTAGALVAMAGLIVLGRVDGRVDPLARFAPLGFDEIDEEVLLLDQPIDGDDALLLDDPLPALGEQSRVVRLFAAQPQRIDDSTPLAKPGEMVARIEDFLGLGRDTAPASPTNQAQSADASAALHAALADIRRSLRQG